MRPSHGTAREEQALLIGASRGLGYAIAEKYLELGWRVVATARRDATRLRTLAESSHGRLEVETVDINEAAQVNTLRERLAPRTFDSLFVNAGVKNDDRETSADVSTDEFVRVMVTNALSPLRVVEALKALVPASGTIAVMSSGQGSVANNITGGYEVCCNTSTISAESSPGEACCLRHNRMSATEVYETIGPGRRRRC